MWQFWLLSKLKKKKNDSHFHNIKYRYYCRLSIVWKILLIFPFHSMSHSESSIKIFSNGTSTRNPSSGSNINFMNRVDFRVANISFLHSRIATREMYSKSLVSLANFIQLLHSDASSIRWGLDDRGDWKMYSSMRVPTWNPFQFYHISIIFLCYGDNGEVLVAFVSTNRIENCKIIEENDYLMELNFIDSKLFRGILNI